jgi:hypothetical protein
MNWRSICLLAALALAVWAPVSLADPPAVVYVDDSYTGGESGFGTSLFNDIQPAIDAVAAGGVINVYPGTYSRDEANGRDPMTGGAGSNDFNIFVNKDITIQGVDAGGDPITDYDDVAAYVSAKRNLPTFGQSGIFVQADGVTITGLDITGPLTDNNKNLETNGDDLTVKYCQLHASDGVSAIYISDWNFLAGPPATSHIQTYRIEGNLLNGGGTWACGVRIANGAGWTGSAVGRVITGNTFYNNSYGIEFVGPGADSWDVYPVGAATITGNAFTVSDKGHVTAWGEYLGAQGYADPDWAGILSGNGNTFDKAAVTWTSGGQARSWELLPSFKYVRGIYSGIQRYCLNRAAQAGDRVQILPGIYEEQLDIAKNLTLDGAGEGATIIRSPATLATYFTTPGPNNNYPVVYVHGANDVDIKDLTVDGMNRGSANYRFYGIAFWNAGGSVTSAEVLNVMDSAFSGAQHGVGVYAYNDIVGSYDIDMTDVLVDGYQKTAVALSGDGLTVDLTRVTVVGQGDTDVTAQNGIQVGYGAGGTLTDCDVSGNSYTGSGNWTASGILPLYGTSLAIDGATLDGNQTSVYFIDMDGSLDGSTVTTPRGDALYAYATGAKDGGSFARLAPQPFDSDLHGRGTRASVAVDITDSQFYGAGVTNSWGPSAYADGGIVNFSVSGCYVSNWDWGVVAYEYAGGTVTSHVNDNVLAGNISYGMYTNAVGKAEQDGTNNWWGDPSGPNGFGPGTGDAVSDGIDFDPWKTANIVCDPDPEYLTEAQPTKTIAVRYLGGGEGLLYGYSLKFSWDGNVVTTAANKVTQGDLLYTVPQSTFFFASKSGNEITVDCARLGTQPGVTGPGTMFTIEFTGVNVGTSPIDITILNVRDNANQPLTGYFADDGTLIVDITKPVVTNVKIWNDTLITDDYIKNGDLARLTATVTDNGPPIARTSIWANLSGLRAGGAAVNPDTYDSGTGAAVWNAWAATCTPADGTVTVTVDATDVIGNPALQGSDTIVTDNTKPAVVTGFNAAPGHQKCDLLWTNGYDLNWAGVTVRRLGNAEYPMYPLFVAGWPGGLGGYYPATYAAGTEVYNGTGSGSTDAVSPRDIYYYQAFCYDRAGNYGLAASTACDLSTNYWLGDITSVMGEWGGYNGRVDDADINFLGGMYHVTGAAWPWNQCDVGPTVHPNYSRVGLPKPDNFIGFEDLMVFAMNYGVVAPRIVPLLPGSADEALALSLAEISSIGDEVQVAVRLDGNAGEVKGVSAVVAFDPTELEFVSARLTPEMQTPLAQMFFWSGLEDGKVVVDLAVLGTGVSIGGSGDVAVLTFRALSGEYTLEFDEATLRDVENEALAADLDGLVSRPGLPTVFRLAQNAPNPFNPKTTVAYEVPQVSEVTIRVYDVTGRLVTTLVDGTVEPGRYAATWDGRNDSGEAVGSGVYFCTMETPNYHATHKMTLLK